MKNSEKSPKPYLFYDGNCGFCLSVVRRFEKHLVNNDVQLYALQDPVAREKLELKNDEIPDEMKLITANGLVLGGASAFQYLARWVWWLWPLYVFSFLPGAKHLLNWGYKKIADNRSCISGACSLHDKRDPRQ